MEKEEEEKERCWKGLVSMVEGRKGRVGEGRGGRCSLFLVHECDAG